MATDCKCLLPVISHCRWHYSEPAHTRCSLPFPLQKHEEATIYALYARYRHLRHPHALRMEPRSLPLVRAQSVAFWILRTLMQDRDVHQLCYSTDGSLAACVRLLRPIPHAQSSHTNLVQSIERDSYHHTCIVAVFGVLNFHLLLFACFYEPNGSINYEARHYCIYPMWQYVHLGVYSAVPFVLMVAFNSGVVYHLLRIRRESTLQNSRIQHRTISITLIVTTSLFLILTTPSGIVFSFFLDIISNTVSELLDGMYFTYHTLSFPLYLITFPEFRREFLAMTFYWRRVQRRASTKGAPGQIRTIQS